MARKIRNLFQASYAVEAALLKATKFPPLLRTLERFIHTETQFYGLFEGQTLAAVVEISMQNDSTHIQSLVVHPDYFRQGLGSKLIRHVLSFRSKFYTIETGLDNKPAIQLYEQFGFQKIDDYTAEFGIRKVRLLKDSS